MKTCSSCSRLLPLESFARQRTGFRSTCRECDAARRHAHYCANRAKSLETRRRYRQSHKESVRRAQLAYGLTLRGFTSRLWKRLNDRTVNGTHPRYCNRFDRYYLDQGVRLVISRVDFELWVSEHWTDVVAMREAGLRPSLDRIDSSGHYSRENMRFVPLSENTRAAARSTLSKRYGYPGKE